MTTYTKPSDSELAQTALDFLKLNPKRYKALKENGELEATIEAKVVATKHAADILITQGVFENQAWLWAVREHILETEAD